MKNLNYLLSVIVVLSLFGSCSKNTQVPERFSVKRNSVLVKKKMVGKTNLALINNENGDVESVNYLDDVGNILDGEGYQINVEAACPIDDVYIAFLGFFSMLDDNGDEVEYYSLIVNVETGQFYDFEGYFPQEKKVYADSNGFKYFKDNQTVFQLDTKNGELAIKRYLPQGQNVSQFVVDGEGNCLYSSYDAYDILKLKTVEGEIRSVVTSASSGMLCKTSDGRIVSLVSNFENQELYEISLKDSLAFTLKATGGVLFDSQWFETGFDGNKSVIMDYKHPEYGGCVIDDKNYWIHKISYNNSFSFFDRKENLLLFRDHKASGMTIATFDVSAIDYSTSFLDLEEGIQIPDSYEVYDFSVIDEDEATFRGMRFSDGKLVNCHVKGSEVTVVDEEGDESYTVLTKIN